MKGSYLSVFRSRRPIGLTWQGQPDGGIVHRILWLDGLEEGWNRGGSVDTFRRKMAEVRIPDRAVGELAEAGSTIARAEGFTWHAISMEARKRD